VAFSSAQDAAGADAVAGGFALAPQLRERDMAAEMAEDHGEAGRPALDRLHLAHARNADAPWPAGVSTRRY
jgi:hypothetical protein